MAMVQMSGALPGGMPGGMPGGLPGGMPTNGMVGGVPPSPGANTFGSSPAQIQQKMLRQRQLALERRRIAGRHASGGMAQANQLPADNNLYVKAPGWDRVLGEGIEKPGSLAEKAEQAFATKKAPTVVKAINSLPSVDEKTEESDQPVAVSSRSNLDSQSKPKRASTRGKDGVDDEIEVCDIIDSVLLDAPKGDNQRGQNIQKPQVDRGAGWDLHVEHQRAAPAPAADSVTQVSSVAANTGSSAGDGGRRWYKPWSRAPKPAPAPAPAPVEKKPTVEETAISAFNADRHGVATPDSIPEVTSTGASGMAWGGVGGGGGGGGARARRQRPQPSEDTDVDFIGEMMAPGAIDEGAAPAPFPKRAAAPPPPHAVHTPVGPVVAPTVTSVQPFSIDARPESKTTDSSGVTPFARPRRDEISEAANFKDLDEMSDVGDRPARPDRQRPSREPGWNGQAEGNGEQMVRKRFWKPFGGGQKNPPQSGTPETTMVCAFDG